METPIVNDGARLPLVGHLQELRIRIITSLAFLLSGALVAAFFSNQLLTLLKLPAVGILTDFIVTKPTEAVIVYFKISIYAGAILSLPFILWQLWIFIKPALPNGLSVAIPLWFLSILALFVFGTVFTYFILIPASLKFLIKISYEAAKPMISLGSYISFVVALLTAGGIIFEMPVICAFLTKIGLISASLMRKKRKVALFAMAVFSAVITPTTDVFNMLLFMLPMLILYEISILVSAFMGKAAQEFYPSNKI